MTNEMRTKAVNLAASYFANWKYYEATLDFDEARKYYNKYEAAANMAALMGIEAREIEETAWAQYGNEIGQAHATNNATW